MQLTHRFVVPTPVEETWAHFQDIAALAECFPGAQVTSADDDTFQGTCKVKLGPISLLYTGSGTFVERDAAAHRFVVDAKGRDKRGNGTAGAAVTLSMASSDDGTEVEVLTDLSVTGKPAQFGRGVMQDVSDKLLGQFVACLEERLGGGEAEPDQDAGPASEPTGAAAVGADGITDQDAGPASTPDAPVVDASEAEAPAVGASEPRPVTSIAGGRHAATSAGGDDALDLGAAVLPVLLKTYGKQVAAVVLAVVGIAILIRILWR